MEIGEYSSYRLIPTLANLSPRSIFINIPNPLIIANGTSECPI